MSDQELSLEELGENGCESCTIESNEESSMEVKDERIILYSNHCPKCKILREKLDNKGIHYMLVDDMETMIKLGFRSMPMLMVNGNALIFIDAISWINSQQ